MKSSLARKMSSQSKTKKWYESVKGCVSEKSPGFVYEHNQPNLKRTRNCPSGREALIFALKLEQKR